MRLGLIAMFAALLLAAIASQNTLLQSTEAQDTESAITACAVQGEGCAQPPLDGLPSETVLEHRVLVGACHTADLHVMEYVPGDSSSGEPVVAQWCAN